MAGEDTTQVPEKVSVAEFEKEFGMEGNTPAAESDAAAAVASGEATLDDIERSTTELGGIDTKTVERQITDEEALRGLDDNLERMEKEAELEAQHAAEDAEEEADDSAADDDAEEEDAAGDEGSDAVEEEASEEGEETEESGEEEGDVAADDGEDADPWASWVKENLDDDSAADLVSALMADENVTLPLKAHGKTENVPLKEIMRRASGYSGEVEVEQRSRAAAARLKQAEEMTAQATQATEHAQSMVEAVTAQIDDAEKFGNFLVNRGELDYLKNLHGILDETLQRAEEDPQSFHMNRRLGGIENALAQLLNGGGGTAEETSEGRTSEADDASQPDPRQIPDDLGFIQGQGYRAPYTEVVRRQTQAIIDGATAAGAASVTYQDVVAAWVKEGKTRQITDVAKGLIAAGKRDGRKKKIAADPPVKKRTPGRTKTGKQPSSETATGKPGEWDDIPKKIVAQLQADQAASELQS